jgi:hypothetical protein
MKKHTRFYLFGALLIYCTAGMLSGCQPSGPGLPTRKKMPDFNSDDNNFESAIPFSGNPASQSQSSFAFSTSNVDLVINGATQGFVSIPLPDAAVDSSAISLINTVKPFALTMMSAWAKQQRHGVVIDLSAHNGAEVHRTDYVLEKYNDFTIPVVVMWDQASTYRVSKLKSIIGGLPAVSLSCISGNDPTGNFQGR